MSTRHLILAVQFLTRLPTPQIDMPEPGELSRTAPYFPLVGLMVGGVLALAVWVGGLVNPWLGALAGILAWVWVTGGLHLDGLSDVADAFGAAHRDPERFMEVLKDPHIGSFGVLAIVLQVAAKLVLLASIPHAHWPWALFAILLVCAWSRWGALVWSLHVPALQAGMAKNLSGGSGRAVMLGWCGALMIASAFVAPWLLAALVIVPLIALYWRRVLGGLTGDCMGASIEVTESLLLFALVVGYTV